ncbi:MAG: hypothetical protein FWG81_02375 [Betaproteobacteria bacterium]|nr:hypothetical protein [Betaproteobacteria bacterium]
MTDTASLVRDTGERECFCVMRAGCAEGEGGGAVVCDGVFEHIEVRDPVIGARWKEHRRNTEGA